MCRCVPSPLCPLFPFSFLLLPHSFPFWSPVSGLPVSVAGRLAEALHCHPVIPGRRYSTKSQIWEYYHSRPIGIRGAVKRLFIRSLHSGQTARDSFRPAGIHPGSKNRLLTDYTLLKPSGPDNANSSKSKMWEFADRGRLRAIISSWPLG